jgi:hypothetical protein
MKSIYPLCKVVYLSKAADFKGRIEALKILHEKAESKVLHADKYRQANLNFAIIIFAGLFATALKFHSRIFSPMIAIVQTLIMVIFTIWDRRWHETKHGWDNTGKNCYQYIIDLTNDEDQDIEFDYYEVKAAK